MKIQLNQLILIFTLPVLLLGETADHLIFKQIALAPISSEMVVIHNPTYQDVSLSNYYLTDAINNSTSKFYYNLPSGVDFWSGTPLDFIARFPDITISAGSDLVLGLHDDAFFYNYYEDMPDLSLIEDMLNAVDGQTTKPANPNFDILQNPEVLILFYWDGSSPTVKDVDYFLWGNNSFAVDKTTLPGYQADTPVENQVIMPGISDNKVYFRPSNNEYESVTSGGNGITGHDETSEDFMLAWNIVYNRNQITSISDILDGMFATGATIIIQGLVVEFADIRPSNGPQVITVEDSDGYRLSLTIWDWDVASSIIGPMIDPYNSSQYVIQASGVLDFYNGWQLEILTPNDILQYSVYHPEGEFVGEEVIDAKIEPAPFVIIPSLGERLDFTYSFPSNSRVVIRIFDLSGRFVTSLVDRYYEQSGTVLRQQDNSDWNGRDHLGQIVPPGTYFMNIETNNFSTGKTSMDSAPIVVGVKF